MKRHLVPASALAASTALAWAALTWQPAPPPAMPLSAADSRPVMGQSGPLPVIEVEPDVMSMAERPLFSAGRRPADGEPEIAMSDAGPSDLPKVRGVALSGGIAIAVVSDEDGRQKSVRQGDQIAGWTVETVRPDFVSFGSDGSVIDVPVFIRK